MTDLYIETPTRADYDALILLAEAAGYMWINDCNPTEWNDHWGDDGWLYEKDGTVIELDGNYLYLDSVEHVASEEHKIETIPNLAKIKAIWKVQPDDHKAFFKGKSYKHPLPSDESVIMLEMTDELAEGLMDIYKALAVEYKPQESKAMNEKVKLPKFICDGINDLKVELSIKATESPTEIADFMEKLNHVNSEIHSWIYYSTTNQWDLFDALRYGYEAEPEPRWGIKAGHSYLYEPNDKSFGPDEEPFSYSSRYDADQVIVKLGFGEVVDLNKEGKADE